MDMGSPDSGNRGPRGPGARGQEYRVGPQIACLMRRAFGAPVDDDMADFALLYSGREIVDDKETEERKTRDATHVVFKCDLHAKQFGRQYLGSLQQAVAPGAQKPLTPGPL